MRTDKVTNLINLFDSRGLFVEFYQIIATPNSSIADVVTHDGGRHRAITYDNVVWNFIL